MKRKNRLGVIVDPEMWTKKDWRALLKALVSIQKRHKKFYGNTFKKQQNSKSNLV